MAEHPFLTERKDFFSCLDRRDGRVEDAGRSLLGEWVPKVASSNPAHKQKKNITVISANHSYSTLFCISTHRRHTNSIGCYT